MEADNSAQIMLTIGVSSYKHLQLAFNALRANGYVYNELLLSSVGLPQAQLT